MLTRCPACDTTFRITPEQLKARQGRVRCGHCQYVFNALDTLIEEVVPAAAVVPAPAEEPSPIPESVHWSHTTPEEDAGALDVDLVLDADGPAEAEAPGVAADIDPVAVASAQAEALESEQATESDTRLDAEPLLHEDEEPRHRAWPWAVAGLLALVALVLQVALLYRVELAVLYPESRALLLEACDVIGCELALPSKPELMSIESSDLHPDTSQPGRLQLVATLKNRAPFAQVYPHLELTLTDTADQALARKVLAPADYLAKDAKPQAGFGANKDLAVTLNLDAGNLPAAGYRLYLFYP